MSWYTFGNASRDRISTMDERLQEILYTAIQYSPMDFGIPPFGGKRTAEEQNKLFKDDKSECDGYVKISAHQSGLAFDIYAFRNGKATWDEKSITLIMGHIIAVARKLGYDLRWGGDWDGDRDFSDQTFHDLCHAELIV